MTPPVRRGRRHRWFCVAVVVVAVAGACSDGGSVRDADGSVTRKGSMSVYDIQDGDCLEAPSGVETELSQVTVVPCDEPHTHEVYLVDDTALDAKFDVYPGAPDIEGVASKICFDGFADFVGSEVIDSALSFTYLYPTLKSWTDNKPPDRTVACLVVSEETTGSLKGSGR